MRSSLGVGAGVAHGTHLRCKSEYFQAGRPATGTEPSGGFLGGAPTVAPRTRFEPLKRDNERRSVSSRVSESMLMKLISCFRTPFTLRGSRTAPASTSSDSSGVATER